MDEAPLMLSVSGLRGVVGRSLTPPVAARYAAAFGTWLHTQARTAGQRGGAAPHVVVGRDSRPSGPMVEAAALAGLIATGCRVTTLGIVATPTVAVMVEQLGAQAGDGGLVITASHNPIEWNGLKALRHDGAAPPAEQARQIVQRYERDRCEYVPVERLQPAARDDSANAVHVQRVLRHVDAAAIRQRRLRVVLDSVHGAGGAAAAVLLHALGVEVVHLFAEPTGRFPHTPEPTRENLTGLCEAVRRHAADAGFAQDPDADRLAIVDERGVYIGEEYTLALAAMHVLEKRATGAATERRSDGATEGAEPVLVANLSTSRMIDDLAARHGAAVVRTPVGEAHVAAAMRARRALIGGEGNGGVIWPPVVHVRDSLGGMALVLEMLAQRGGRLSEAVERLPRYAIVKDKVELSAAAGAAEAVVPRLRQRFASQQLDLQDGVRIDWPDRWVHARPSNTEPILRIIAEARDPAAAHALVAEVRAALGV